MARHGHRKPKRSEGESRQQANRTSKNLKASLSRRLKVHPKDKLVIKRLSEL